MNATFYTFKDGSGKWKYEGRGIASDTLFKECFTTTDRRRQILEDNDGVMPGTIYACPELVVVCIPDADHKTGWPLLLRPDA